MPSEESEGEKHRPIVWVTVEDPLDLDDGEQIAQAIEETLPSHEVIVTTDELELIDANEMKDALERMIDDE